MGRYDNYNNRKRIEQCRKKLKKLSGKRKPNLFEIDMAQKELDTMLLFESCQIFGRENLLKSINDPNADIMFSDDNRVMWFVSMLVPYGDIVSYCFLENTESFARTKTKSKGVISRAIVGGAIGGVMGAAIGAASAGSTSTTRFYESKNGFILQIELKDGMIWQYPVESSGVIFNRLSPLWIQLGAKLQMILDENAKG